MTTATGTNFDLQASIRRITGTFRHEPVDRVPIMPPLHWDPREDVDAQSFGDWRDEEGFRRIAHLVEEHCDVWPVRCNAEMPNIWENIGYQRFLEAPAEYVEKLPEERISDFRTRYTTLLHTPGGVLRWAYDVDDGILTHWDREKPIKTPEDVEAMLSVPYSFVPPDTHEYDEFRRCRAQMGRDAVGGCGINSMVAMLCGMMDYTLFLEWTLTEPGLLKMLADEWLRRTGEKVEWLLSQGVGPFWHFNGVERAAPPMMSPAQWEEWVVPYDGEIMRRIKSADPEAKIHVHCHGLVRSLFDSFVSMGVDSTDPVEPLPKGDVDIVEAKESYAGRLVFYGSVQFLDMETASADTIEEIVRRTLQDGGRHGIVLMPTAGPHERPSPRFYQNAERYILSGLKYGTG